MSDPKVLLAKEAESMGRPCVMRGHSALDVGDVRVETLVYELDVPLSEGKVQYRYAVYVDGRVDSSGVVGFGFGVTR